MATDMLRLIRRMGPGSDADTHLTLTFEQRTKGRLRVTLDDGRAAGLFLDRGPILRHGDRIAGEDGSVIEVCAAPEPLSIVRCDDMLLFARVCYHLGNRHVPLQIAVGELRYLHDHVLDDMVRGLGLEVGFAKVPFEPEAGAYGEHASGHDHHGHHAH